MLPSVIYQIIRYFNLSEESFDLKFTLSKHEICSFVYLPKSLIIKYLIRFLIQILRYLIVSTL